MVEIDGSKGEGGGQVLRSALALSMATGQPFHMVNVRANREKPGLMRQHLTCVQAAREVCSGGVNGAEVGSREVMFVPGAIRPDAYRFAIGTAGSTMLVMQAILPAVLFAGGEFAFTVEGGTHNTSAPIFEFFQRVLLPRLAAMGAQVEADLRKHGFYPAGGGCVVVQVRPGAPARPLTIEAAGKLVDRRIRVVNAHIHPDVPRREISALAAALGWEDRPSEVFDVTESRSPGNALMAIVAGEGVYEVFSAIAERGKRSEVVADEVIEQVQAFLAHGAPVGEHLADQLLVPMALGAGGSFVTGPLSSHTSTNIETIRLFLGDVVTTEPASGGGRCVRVNVRGRM
ncbi:MAG: RNA 3'-terminal phosphate cyclase [Phycisphaerales bacterium]